MFGSWTNYAIAVIVLLFTSLGVGFLISLISETDTQAVQYSMLLLLASIFFSGFFLDLRLMWRPMKVLAWSLPATYGIRTLQDIMLRGASIPPLIIEGLAAIGVGLFLVDWLLLRRRMEAQYS
jgi:ABC-2 type transport system permease protein